MSAQRNGDMLSRKFPTCTFGSDQDALVEGHLGAKVTYIECFTLSVE